MFPRGNNYPQEGPAGGEKSLKASPQEGVIMNARPATTYPVIGVRYRRALLPGRFQPFHLGHLHAVRYALSLSRELVIAITAAQYCYTPENPFTAGERAEMIRLALGELYSRCYLVPVDNVANNALWLRHLSLRTPSFEAVFTNNELVRMLAELEGYRVEPIPFLKREAYEGRVIRRSPSS